ncbi:hypothetical protein L4C33_18770 [Vibrio makurazakiensis]
MYSMKLSAEEVPSTILDYDYLYASVGSGSLNEDAGVNSNASIFSIGGSYQADDNWLVVGDYTARFLHPDETTTRADTLMAGAGYRYVIVRDFDFVTSYQIGVTKAKVELNDAANTTVSSDTEFIHGVKVALNYGFSESWIAIGSVQFNRSDLLDEEVYHTSLRYLVTPKFAVGGFYNHRNGQDERTNEIGINFLLEL